MDRDGRLCYDYKIFIVLVISLVIYFVYNTTVFTRNIQDTFTKLSGIICRPPKQIKFEYHDSSSLPVALRMG